MATNSPINLTGPTYCVLTGASQGIGRAIAVEMSRLLGPNSLMLLLARNKLELARTAQICQSDAKVLYESIDLSTATNSEMKSVLMKSLEGRNVIEFATNVIFHNVGSLGNLLIETSHIDDLEDLRSYFDLNVFKVIALNTQFLKIFQEVEDRVVVVNITSLGAIEPMQGLPFYCSGKAAREMYFRVLAEENSHVRVLNYSPGPVKTAMVDRMLSESNNEKLKGGLRNNQILEPEATAQKCVKVLQAGRFSPGQHVDYFDI